GGGHRGHRFEWGGGPGGGLGGGCINVWGRAGGPALSSGRPDTAMEAATSRSTMSSVLSATSIGASGLRNLFSGAEPASRPVATATCSAARPAGEPVSASSPSARWTAPRSPGVGRTRSSAAPRGPRADVPTPCRSPDPLRWWRHLTGRPAPSRGPPRPERASGARLRAGEGRPGRAAAPARPVTGLRLGVDPVPGRHLHGAVAGRAAEDDLPQRDVVSRGGLVQDLLRVGDHL